MNSNIIKAKYEDNIGLVSLWHNRYADGREDYTVRIKHNARWHERNGHDITRLRKKDLSDEFLKFATRQEAEGAYYANH